MIDTASNELSVMFTRYNPPNHCDSLIPLILNEPMKMCCQYQPSSVPEVLPLNKLQVPVKVFSEYVPLIVPKGLYPVSFFSAKTPVKLPLVSNGLPCCKRFFIGFDFSNGDAVVIGIATNIKHIPIINNIFFIFSLTSKDRKSYGVRLFKYWVIYISCNLYGEELDIFLEKILMGRNLFINSLI